MTIILGYLPRIEQLQLQGLDKWWYSTGVGRVQVHLILEKMFFFVDQTSVKIMAVNQAGK